ncbi:MAG: hypothetical protein Q9162_001240 [Coniocarpon cinnabarinum]
MHLSPRAPLEEPKPDLYTTLCEAPLIKSVFDQAHLPYNELGATVFALLYAYGLTEFNVFIRGPAGLSLIGTNSLLDVGTLVMPGQATVIRPNVDTIYAAAIVDLSKEGLVVTLPEMEADRYYAFSFFDPYGDNFATIGSRYASKSGEYLLRSSVGTGEAGITTKDCSSYENCIESPTYNGVLLIRVEVKQNSTAELNYANSYIRSIQLNATNERDSSISPLTPADVNVSSSFPEATLQLLANLGPRNPPQNQALAEQLPSVLAYAGISNNKYTPLPSVNLTQAYTLLNDTLTTFYASPTSRDILSNGWTTLSSSYIGSYENGTAILGRAFVAAQGYGANTPDQSIYPSPSNFTYSLPSSQSLLLTFNGKPPLLPDGFWSLTLYNDNGALVQNPVGVYALGDRSGLTYADGSPVYGAETGGDRDAEAFQILVQAADVTPPANWTTNWLPAPAGGGSFQITLRFYSEEEALLTGEYVYPGVGVVDAIVH